MNNKLQLFYCYAYNTQLTVGTQYKLRRSSYLNILRGCDVNL